MKGVILAGGTGSRLEKLTSVLNKHLVAVGEVPMIEYPLNTLIKMGIKEITVVTGAEHAGTVVQYLTKEHEEIDFTYKIQKKAGGIAEALSLTENVCRGDKMAVILGDNIFEENFSKDARRFEEGNGGAMVFLKKVNVEDARRFGIAIIENGKVKYVEEKPEKPKSDLAMTGLYMFNSEIFNQIRKLNRSARGELEITDAIDKYVAQENCSYSFVSGFWSDAGTHASRKFAEDYIYNKGKNILNID
jgi:glucose-1-phosphate thymidylyltransferase